MTPEKEEFFLNTYPSLFEPDSIRKDPRKSCMAWGFECGDGWADILNIMFEKITALNPSKFHVNQIKEKFGTLRVYWGGNVGKHENAINAIINEAEEKSAITCENCGEPAKCRCVNNWYVTLCNKHLEEYKEKRNIKD